MNTKLNTYIEVSATIKRKDGKIENLGVISTNKPTILQRIKSWLQL